MRTRLLLLLPALLALAPAAAADPPAAPADTLHYSVRAGQTLLTVLPVQAEDELRPIRLPALSWLVGHTLLWRTVAGEEGHEILLIERRRGSARDTLVLRVEVRPADAAP